MSVLKTHSVELAIDHRIKDRLGALMEVSTLDFRAMAVAAGLNPTTSFRGIRVHFLDFGESDLTGFDFSGADLTGCDFSRAKIDGAIFAGACLNELYGVKMRAPEVFISYTPGDHIIARSIADGLNARGIQQLLSSNHVYGFDKNSIPDIETSKRPIHFFVVTTQENFIISWIIKQLNRSVAKTFGKGIIFAIFLIGNDLLKRFEGFPNLRILNLDNLDSNLDIIATELIDYRELFNKNIGNIS